MEIIPAILEKSWPEIEEKIKLVEGLTDWIQLDISDGQFTPNKTWDQPQDLFSLQTDLNIEAHLMINEPWLKIEKWLASSVKRIVVQVEAFASPESVRFSEIINKAKKYGKEVVWGFKLETPWQSYFPKGNPSVAEGLPFGDGVLFLSVDPGYQGQNFNRQVLEKISSLKSKYDHIKIEVDGGINPSIVTDLKSAGADSLVIGSYIFGHTNPQEAVKELQHSRD